MWPFSILSISGGDISVLCILDGIQPYTLYIGLERDGIGRLENQIFL